MCFWESIINVTLFIPLGVVGAGSCAESGCGPLAEGPIKVVIVVIGPEITDAEREVTSALVGAVTLGRLWERMHQSVQYQSGNETMHAVFDVYFLTQVQ